MAAFDTNPRHQTVPWGCGGLRVECGSGRSVDRPASVLGPRRHPTGAHRVPGAQPRCEAMAIYKVLSLSLI